MSTGLKIKIFADGADLESMRKLAADPAIRGFTTNPTLMRQAGVRDYEAFARKVLANISGRPISFEVFSDELAEMEAQALYIAAWGENVYVKIPVTNTEGESTIPVIKSLAARGVKLNVTALLTLSQVESTAAALDGAPASCISVFAGRIADTGRDPLPIMSQALEIMRPHAHLELIWASPRELLNIVQADSIGCHIITATPDLLKKLPLIGKDLGQFSLETVRMFHNDARAAGFALAIPPGDERGEVSRFEDPFEAAIFSELPRNKAPSAKLPQKRMHLRKILGLSRQSYLDRTRRLSWSK